MLSPERMTLKAAEAMAAAHGARSVDAAGTISIAAASVAEDSCDDGASISPKQQQYLDALPTAERYTVFGERLVIFTSDDGALVFQSERVTPSEPTESQSTAK